MGILKPFIQAFLILLQVIEWIVIVWVIISWILFFASQTSFRWRYRTAHNLLMELNEVFTRMTNPFLRPFRRLLPPYKTGGDRKSTRLNSSHVRISYAVFCLK